ncbi:MAG: pentapeptide repeat-containing protein [Chloroflexi bacterium]|nr:pentapeptide repeat-containing protein [Chloroflexota bacterium]
MMDEQRIQALSRLGKALKALHKTTERALHTGMTEGVAAMAVSSYQKLQRQAAELLEGDFYVSDVLALEVEPEYDDDRTIRQVQFVASQLTDYLKGVLSEYEPEQFTRPPSPESLGRELRDQIVNLTRLSISRALQGIDIAVEAMGGTYMGQDLAEHDFSEEDLTGVNMSGANLRGARFAKADLTAANFSGANLSGANLDETDLDAANFSGANLENASLRNADLDFANFTGANLRGANLTGANIDNVNLSGAILPDGTAYQQGQDVTRFTLG